jgi:lipoate-protein ligase A
VNYLFETLRLLHAESAWDGPMHMAMDEALLALATSPTLRFFQWNAPQATFGYFENWDAIRSLCPTEWLLTRRWTGGGLVMHGDDLTFSVIIPAGHPAARMHGREIYGAIHGALSAALQNQGIQTYLAGRPDTSTTGLPCFQAPVEYDLILQNAEGKSVQKIAGGAMRRTRSGILYQGSVQFVDFTKRSSIVESLPGFLAREPAKHALHSIELEHAQMLCETKYATHAWLRGRQA